MERKVIKSKTPCGDNGFDPKLLYAYENEPKVSILQLLENDLRHFLK
jgi:hypothetical protein